jgi:hypothetical protein
MTANGGSGIERSGWIWEASAGSQRRLGSFWCVSEEVRRFFFGLQMQFRSERDR